MKKLLGTFAAFAVAAFAPLAQAEIQLSYTINGGSSVNCGTSSSSVTCANTTGAGLDITTLTASSNSPGTASLSKDESSTMDLTNSGSIDETIVVDIESTGFTSPTTPPSITFLSNVGGTVLVGQASNLLSYYSCIDTSNTLQGCVAAAAGSTAITSATGTPSITAAGSFNNSQTSLITSLGSPYSIDEVLTITLDPGADINVTTSTVLTPVPEPTSIFLFGGAAILAFGAIRRKMLLS